MVKWTSYKKCLLVPSLETSSKNSLQEELVSVKIFGKMSLLNLSKT